MKILVFAGFAKSLVHFRKELLIEMVAHGHEVVAIAPENDYEQELANIGVVFKQIRFDRLSANLIKDIKLVFTLVKLFKAEKADVYFGYTIKPVVYGSIAARVTGIKRRYTMVTGLGSVFIEGEGKKGYIKQIVKFLYKVAFMLSSLTFFQNPDDISDFVSMRLIKPNKCILVNGSGVNIELYSKCDMPPDPIFLFVGSVMKDKGIVEYISAASEVKKLRPKARFWIVGPLDNRLTSLPKSTLDRNIADGSIEYFGSVDDVRPYYRQCRFFVLPSYREGTPRSVLEAMAIGRPIITTNVPGCRETVVSGENGFLVPIKNTEELVMRMIWLIDNPEKAKAMGIASYKIAKEKYDVSKVNYAMLSSMGL